MAMVFRCRGLGMDCCNEMRAEDDERLSKLAAEHAEKDPCRSAASMPASFLAMDYAAIKDD